MKGTPHEIYLSADGKSVSISNVQDGEYVQTFESRQEIEAFIKELKERADEAFGVSSEPPSQQ